MSGKKLILVNWESFVCIFCTHPFDMRPQMIISSRLARAAFSRSCLKNIWAFLREKNFKCTLFPSVLCTLLLICVLCWPAVYQALSPYSCLITPQFLNVSMFCLSLAQFSSFLLWLDYLIINQYTVVGVDKRNIFPIAFLVFPTLHDDNCCFNISERLTSIQLSV